MDKVVALAAFGVFPLLGDLGPPGCACSPSPPYPYPDSDGTTIANDSTSGTSGTSGTITTGISSTTHGTATTGTTETTGTSDATGLDTTTGMPPLECVDGVLEPSLGPALARLPTGSAGDDSSGSCGGAGSNDVAHQWNVPYSGFFALDTEGSDFDTVLYVLDDCGGNELACNDDAGGSSSRIVAPFEAGARVVVVVDGKEGGSGTAVLGIEPVECPSIDLIGHALPTSYSNLPGTNEHGGACGGGSARERTFRWQAPAAGLYALSLDSEAFSPALYLEEGPSCGGPLLGCNAATTSHAEVMRVLEAGEYVTFYADSLGGEGQFHVDIVALADACPAELLEASASGQITDFPNVMSSSCGPAGSDESGAFVPHADATYAWTSPGMIGSNSGCDLVVTAGFPVALSLQEGACDGPELQCEPGAFDGGTAQYTATVSVGHIPATDFTLTVSPTGPSAEWTGGPMFTLEVVCFSEA